MIFVHPLSYSEARLAYYLHTLGVSVSRAWPQTSGNRRNRHDTNIDVRGGKKSGRGRVEVSWEGNNESEIPGIWGKLDRKCLQLSLRFSLDCTSFAIVD